MALIFSMDCFGFAIVMVVVFALLFLMTPADHDAPFPLPSASALCNRFFIGP